MLHRRHLFNGEGGERAFSETIPVEGAGLINDYLARFEKAVTWLYHDAPSFERGIELCGKWQDDNHRGADCREGVVLDNQNRTNLANCFKSSAASERIRSGNVLT